MVLYCRPSDIVIPTWSLVSGTNDTDYPITNLALSAPWETARATGTGITYRATFGGAQSLQAVAFINTDATAIQLTNGAGLNQAVTIPATPGDGLHLDPWIDLRGLGNTSSTTWNIALTGPTGVALGTPLLVATLREMPLLWNGLQEPEQHKALIAMTDYGVRQKLGLGVRQRVVQGRVIHESFRPDLVALQRDARGPLEAFLLILNPDDSDALYVDLTTDTRVPTRINHRATETPLVFTEIQKGWLL